MMSYGYDKDASISADKNESVRLIAHQIQYEVRMIEAY